MPQIHQNIISNAEISKKFTDDNSPSAVVVEPIEDVSEFLPEEVCPESIDTATLLKLINPRTDSYVIIDLETGKSFEAVRYGGNKHLDTEPKTKKDAEILNSINGQSWDRRAIALYFDGNYYAASMNTMPHGNGFVSDNGYNGHICVHVLNSRTHGSGKVCDKHQSMVQESLQTDIAEILSEVPAISDKTN